jgi:hypothetical protein
MRIMIRITMTLRIPYSLQGYAFILDFLQSYAFMTSKLALFIGPKTA